jgi:hypothetical protein
MKQFGPQAAQATSEGTAHVALFAEDGSVLFHDEVSAAEAGRRAYQLSLEAELRALKGEKTRLHNGPKWPPEGHVLTKGKLVELPKAEA